MKKKVYIKPETHAVQLAPSVILAASVIRKATDEDYLDKNIEGLWDNEEDKGFWAD